MVIISSAVASGFALKTSILTAQQVDSGLHNLASNWETGKFILVARAMGQS